MVEALVMAMQLIGAAALGGVVGYQREAVDRPAGLRTHMLVSLAAALMTIVGLQVTNSAADQTRIAAGVITGIGFLGAGTIIRQGSMVRGLTTAASVFTVAGIGIAVGAGFYLAAVISTALVFGILSYGKRVEVHFIPHESLKELALRSANVPGLIGQIEEKLRMHRMSIRNIRTQEDENGQEVILHLDLRLPQNADPTEIVDDLQTLESVSEIAWVN